MRETTLDKPYEIDITQSADAFLEDEKSLLKTLLDNKGVECYDGRERVYPPGMMNNVDYVDLQLESAKQGIKVTAQHKPLIYKITREGEATYIRLSHPLMRVRRKNEDSGYSHHHAGDSVYSIPLLEDEIGESENASLYKTHENKFYFSQSRWRKPVVFAMGSHNRNYYMKLLKNNSLTENEGDILQAIDYGRKSIGVALKSGCVEKAQMLQIEFVEGKDLLNRRYYWQGYKNLVDPTEKSNADLPSGLVILNIARDLLQLVEALKARRIKHLDIKPENIVINKEEEIMTIDFGHAHKLTENEETLELKKQRGTMDYLAPECRNMGYFGNEYSPRS